MDTETKLLTYEDRELLKGQIYQYLETLPKKGSLYDYRHPDGPEWIPSGMHKAWQFRDAGFTIPEEVPDDAEVPQFSAFTKITVGPVDDGFTMHVDIRFTRPFTFNGHRWLFVEPDEQD